jgi:drug/metabolite transporter (DMT)-like permease
MDGTDWLWCAAIVLVPGALGHLLTAWAARDLPVSLLSQLTLGIPVVAVAGAAVLVGETVTLGQVVAIAFALVMLGLLLRNRVPGPGARVSQPPVSDQEIAELPGITAVEAGVVPAEERVHP